MLERKISVQEVEQIIAKPDGQIKQTKDKTIYYKKLSARKDNLLAAVVVEHFASFGVIEVVTVLVNFEVKK